MPEVPAPRSSSGGLFDPCEKQGKRSTSGMSSTREAFHHDELGVSANVANPRDLARPDDSSALRLGNEHAATACAEAEREPQIHLQKSCEGFEYEHTPCGSLTTGVSGNCGNKSGCHLTALSPVTIPSVISIQLMHSYLHSENQLPECVCTPCRSVGAGVSSH